MAALGLLLGPPVGARTQEGVLWRIGAADDSWRELAGAGSLAAAAALCAEGVAFRPGGDNPASGWPWIHPGPADAWAGSRQHPLRIVFALDAAPQGLGSLRLDLVSTHGWVAPTLRVEVNGVGGEFALPPGTGDGALQDPAQGRERVLAVPFDAGLLRAGENEIQLAVVSGSWLLYDALELVVDARPEAAAEAFAAGLELRPMPFLRGSAEGLQREVDVTVRGLGRGGAARVTLEAGGAVQAAEVPLPGLGPRRFTLTLPEASSPRPLRCGVVHGPLRATAEATLAPACRLTFWLEASVHTDIGYTDLQDRVAELHVANLDQALELCRQDPEFIWNLESSWALDRWLERHGGEPARVRELEDLVRAGRVVVHAFYGNMLTGLCSAEELERALDFARRFGERCGVPVRCAVLTDVPSHVWTVPSVLAAAGVRYLIVGGNPDRGPFLEHGGLGVPSPCWWEGPDGQRVLVWWAESYAYAHQSGLTAPAQQRRDAVAQFIAARVEGAGYPHDDYLLHGCGWDNGRLDPELLATVHRWNETYAWPRIRWSSGADFLEEMERRHGERLPVARGCGGSYWEDGAAAGARATALNRANHERAAAVERLWGALEALGAGPRPAARLSSAWRDILLYDEHTFGAWQSVSDPAHEQTARQWEVKEGFAAAAARELEALERDGMELLASRLQAQGPGVLLFNPSPWPRGGPLELSVPPGTEVADPAAGEALPAQGGLVSAPAVEPGGARVLALRSGGAAPPASAREADRWVRFDGEVLENRWYRLRFDLRRGALAELRDREEERELLDPRAPHGGGEYVYVSGGDGTRAVYSWSAQEPDFVVHRPEGAGIALVEQGPLAAAVEARSRAVHTPSIRAVYRLYRDRKRLDVTFRITKDLVHAKEAAYLAFPFQAERPRFRYEVGGAVVDPAQDLLPGACRDWFAVQRWVRVEDGDFAVVLAPVDSPLVSLCGRNAGKWLRELPLDNGHIYAYVLNNYWHTNYPAGQGGEFTFRFALTSGRRLDDGASARFGAEACVPLLAWILAPGAESGD